MASGSDESARLWYGIVDAPVGRDELLSRADFVRKGIMQLEPFKPPRRRGRKEGRANRAFPAPVSNERAVSGYMRCLT